MAYFLKKSNYKEGTYPQIYESFYDPERKGGAHRSYKALGYVHELQAKGIDDPISFYQEEVIKLNQEFQAAKVAKKSKQISNNSPEKLIGYFPMKNINDKLSVKKYVDLMQTATDFRFNVFDMMSALVYARLVHPCSKSKTYDEVIPKLFDSYDFSLNQLYDGLEYIGCEYEKIIQSEKPVIRNIIAELKKRNSVSGRTIQIADKGLNCAENIFHALKNGDGYIFSKSVKQLPEIEKTWVLLPNDYQDVKNANGEVMYPIKEYVDEFEYKFKDSNTGKEKKFKITEKRIVTYNPKLAKNKFMKLTKKWGKLDF